MMGGTDRKILESKHGWAKHKEEFRVITGNQGRFISDPLSKKRSANIELPAYRLFASKPLITSLQAFGWNHKRLISSYFPKSVGNNWTYRNDLRLNMKKFKNTYIADVAILRGFQNLSNKTETNHLVDLVMDFREFQDIEWVAGIKSWGSALKERREATVHHIIRDPKNRAIVTRQIIEKRFVHP